MKENSPRGSKVTGFQVSSVDPAPNVVISPINPASGSLFRPEIVARSPPVTSNYTIFLEGLLNFEAENLYTLNVTVTAHNGSEVQSTWSVLTVQVLDVNEPPQCSERLTSLGETVQVMEDITPLSAVFYVIASDPDTGSVLNYQIAKVLPTGAAGRFSISSVGAVLSPATGLNYNSGDKNFVLTVVASDQFGANCTGTLTISILPLRVQRLNFTIQSQTVTSQENFGTNVYVANVSAAGPNVRYQLVSPSPYFWIDGVTGVILTAVNLDLEAAPALRSSSLLIHAYDLTTHLSGTATVHVIVADVNDKDPRCTPANFITTVPETTPLGTTFFTLSCTDPDVTNNSLSYRLEPNANSLFKFWMDGNKIRVNNTLDYDSAALALANFQYSVNIVVTDSGFPSRSVTVPVRVTVSPVNEFRPAFQAPFLLSVPENSDSGILVGQVVATDRDWPQDSIQYRISGGNVLNVFYIDPSNGNVYVRVPLDFEMLSNYRLQIQAVDQNQDVDPSNRKTSTQMYTVNVQDENDNAPVCNPRYYEHIIYSTRSNTVPITSILCTDVDTFPDLQYSITHGNVHDRFFMSRNQVMSRNLFSFDPYSILDPATFDLQIEVTDLRFTRRVLVRVTVVHWRTTTAPTTTAILTHSAIVVTAVERFWQPEPWFVAVLTVTAALLIVAVGIMMWKILSSCRTSMFPKPESTLDPLLNSSTSLVTKSEPRSDLLLHSSSNNVPVSPPISESSQSFDGRAKDPVSGRDYLFNSRTGERRWL